MPTPPSATALLDDDPAVDEAIEVLLERLAVAQATIDYARGPDPARAEASEALRARFDSIRGRAPVLPALDAGLGRGPLVALSDGSVKWDLITGIGVHVFGRGDPDLVATALRAALSDIVMQGNLQCDSDAVAFAETLLAEAARTSSLAHAFLATSGCMVNEAALKVCMQRTGGTRVLVFEHCFMGRSLAMAQLGGNPGHRDGLPEAGWVDRVPFHDEDDPAGSAAAALASLDAHLVDHPGEHACFVFELIQGEGGFTPGPENFHRPLMERCREHGIPVWVDEVQTFGRTAAMFHFEQLGLGDLVDVVTVGKMAQVCACLYTAAMSPRPGLLSGTFVGSTVALRVGRRILQRLRDGDAYGPGGRHERLFTAFATRAGDLVDRHPGWFEGIDRPFGGLGGMMRLTPFGGDRQRIAAAVRTMYEEGVITFSCGHGPFHVRFLPPVGVMEPAHLDEVFPLVERAMERTAAEAP